MGLKEYVKQSARSFFIVVTLINVAMMVLGKVFYSAQQPDYKMFGYPVLYGFCSMAPVFVMYSSKELTVGRLLFRKLIQMVLTALLLVLLIFGFDGICAENAEKIAGVGASVIVIYVLEEAISWLVNTRDAERLTESLRRYQEARGGKEAGLRMSS